MKNFLAIGAISAACAVSLGAFGAHALKTRLEPDQLQVFETGVKYQMYHSIALIIVFIVNQKLNSHLISYSGWSFLFGIFFFSGSLYLLSCRELLGISRWNIFLGPVTPLGGILFIAGWIFLFAGAFKNHLQ
jgi:uncharacterized membrane protein YgdD (TMEM256/DUF423 family)